MDVASAIANLGFPIGLAIYLLTRFEKKMEGLESCIIGKDGVIDKLEEISKATKRNYTGRKKKNV